MHFGAFAFSSRMCICMHAHALQWFPSIPLFRGILFIFGPYLLHRTRAFPCRIIDMGSPWGAYPTHILNIYCDAPLSQCWQSGEPRMLHAGPWVWGTTPALVPFCAGTLHVQGAALKLVTLVLRINAS